MGDTQGRDTNHIAEIVTSLKKLGFVHCFILVLNSQERRFNEQIQQAIKLYIAMFGEEFVQNLLLCFTHYGQDQTSQRKRKAQGTTTESIIKSYQAKFKDVFNSKLTQSQFAFIDNSAEDDDLASDFEVEAFEASVSKIKKFALSRTPFFCQDIKEAMKERDSLKQQLDKVKADHSNELKLLRSKLDKQFQAELDDLRSQNSQALRTQKEELER